MELLEEDGLYEIVYLYRMLLAIESENPSNMQLDVNDFDIDFQKDKPFDNAKESFVNKITVYEFLFTHTIDYADRQSIILKKIRSLNEDQLIRDVLIPLLGKMQFYAINMITHHGPNEFGRDLHFYKVDEFGRRIYYAAQVKAVDIHTNSRRIEGNASAIANQLDVALRSETIDEEDNVKKQIDNVMLVTSKEVNHGARLFLHSKFHNRELTMLDGKNLSKLIEKYHLDNRVLGICIKPKMRD